MQIAFNCFRVWRDKSVLWISLNAIGLTWNRSQRTKENGTDGMTASKTEQRDRTDHDRTVQDEIENNPKGNVVEC